VGDGTKHDACANESTQHDNIAHRKININTKLKTSKQPTAEVTKIIHQPETLTPTLLASK
jgi:hypothetical protein